MESPSQRSVETRRRRFRLCFDDLLLDALNPARLQAILNTTRAAAGDATVQLLAIEFPTRSLVLEGTAGGFNRLVTAYFHGQLNEEIYGLTAVSGVVGW